MFRNVRYHKSSFTAVYIFTACIHSSYYPPIYRQVSHVVNMMKCVTIGYVQFSCSVTRGLASCV